MRLGTLLDGGHIVQGERGFELGAGTEHPTETSVRDHHRRPGCPTASNVPSLRDVWVAPRMVRDARLVERDDRVGSLNILSDRRDQLLHRVVLLLVAEAFPELDRERIAVELSVETE